ncbi:MULTISPECIES: AraC family transcriptional regulator [unclassified Desulfovibrio]|uniref:AraC family transcriptional regulator n=1 Tax=unclassified Desulfovibrio TaxID=2593640 RepID=UPI002FDAD6C8
MRDTTDRTYAILREKLLRRMPAPGTYPTPVPGFVLNRRDEVNIPENCWNKPILAMTVQGAKRVVVGNEEYRYGAGNCLLAGVDMPNLSYLTEASPENPYLVMTLELDSHLTTQLAAQIPPAKGPGKTSSAGGSMGGVAVMPTDPEILQAFGRMLDLLDTPEQIPLLAPLISREIHLLLLLGPQGELLKSLNTQGTQGNQIFQGINWLRDNFMQPLDVDELARRLNMAPPTFRKHFKAVTSMSPTQYHKHLRLYEAQRRMLEDHEDVSKASYAVGYESLTQFNREYKRLFGDAPQRNVTQIQASA